MSAKEINLKIDELTLDYLKLLKTAKNYEERKKVFEIYYKTLLTLENIKAEEVGKELF